MRISLDGRIFAVAEDQEKTIFGKNMVHVVITDEITGNSMPSIIEMDADGGEGFGFADDLNMLYQSVTGHTPQGETYIVLGSINV